MTEKANKADEGKVPLDLISSIALMELGKVLQMGARKYDAHNWRKGLPWSRIIAAAMRHLVAYNGGETRDPESGLSHAAHAMCCFMFLLEYERTRPELDDRYQAGK